jgi:hypothetical protein
MNTTADDMGTAGYDIFTGWGMIDAGKALRSVLPPPCPADINRDSVVNGNDLGILLSGWGGSDQDSDLNGDNRVDGIDLGILVGAWGDC